MLRRDNLPVVDAALAVAAFAVSLALVAATESEGGGLDALGVLFAALSSLPLVARRRAPLSVFVWTALASMPLRAIAEPVGPPVGPTIALYFVAASGGGPRAGHRLALAVAVVTLIVHAAVVGLAEDAFPWTALLFGTLLWGGVWLAGERTRLRLERLGELEERALRAEREAERERQLAAAEERMRIARDLHDSAGHAINVILVHAGLGRLRTDRDPEGAREAFETIEAVARETVGEIDQMVGVLRESGEGGDSVEPPAGLAALDALVERHRATGLDVTATWSGERRPLAPGVDQGAYRILQEALTNAARHGYGSAEVLVGFGGDSLELTVTNPIGDELGRDGDGHGVVGMRERAALLGGGLEAGAREGRFRVHARLPLAGRPQ
ncbi:MAG: sensor histidine kinase [Thermoleophilaceae bacterium]